jgi:hypothetical protein
MHMLDDTFSNPNRGMKIFYSGTSREALGSIHSATEVLLVSFWFEIKLPEGDPNHPLPSCRGE